MKSKIAKKFKFDRFDIVILGIFVAFFSALLIIGEPIYVNDTYQYDNQMIMREPGYALLMQVTRYILPENYYELIIIIQNILAMICNTVFIIFIRKCFNVNKALVLLFTSIMLAPHIMTPICSATHLILTNSLMTEAILFSLFPLSILFLINAIKSGNPLGKESIIAILYCFFVTLVRGQMMVLYVVWFIVMSIMVLFKKDSADKKVRIKRKVCNIFVIGVIFCLVFVSRSVVTHIYNYCQNGLFVDTISRDALSYSNVLYAADREDGEAIEDEGLRNLFYEMYDAADANKMNYKYSPKGLLNKAIHHELCHDDINFIYFSEPAKQYIADTKRIYIQQFQEVMIEVDNVAAELTKELIPELFGTYVVNYIAIITQGFIRTVAYMHPLLAWYALAVYIFAIVVTIVLWRKNSKSIPAAFMAFTLLGIVGNVCATGLMLQCISRYMIYYMPMFYIAGILELLELWHISKNKI